MKRNSILKNFIRLSLFIVAVFSGWDTTAQTVLINPSSPWTVPAGVTQIKVEVWGGGGAGGGCNSAIGTSYGSGGGGGAYSTATINVTNGDIFTIVKGAGGTAASDANGGNGTASSVSGTPGSVTANPGLGGGRRGGAAGAGGSGTFNGGTGGLATAQGAGGGGGAGNNAAGAAGANASFGAGGAGLPNIAPYVGGNGGANRSSNGTGNIGAVPGGGGGGGYQQIFNGAKSGGNGGAGQVVITYCPTYTLSSIAAQTPICVSTGSSTISVTGNLPIGNYNVIYNRSLPFGSGLTATMAVTTINTGSFLVPGLSIDGLSTITVTNIVSAASSFCNSTISSNNSVDVQVDQLATVFAGSNQVICATTSTVLAGAIGGSATSAVWSGGTGTFIPDANTLNATYLPSGAEITAGSVTLTLTTNDPVGACGAVQDQMLISILKAPTNISITPASSTICVGNSQSLVGNATIGSASNLSSEHFNTAGSFIYAAAGTNTGDGTIFSQRTGSYSVNATTITNNDATRFMIAASSAIFANASTSTTLTSPVINTTAYSSLNFTFRHSYTKGNEAGVSVQVSTNGGTSWSNVNTSGVIIGTNTYTTNQGANNNFVAGSIDLTSFKNQPNLRIRFDFVSSITFLGTSWWAIDDAELNGTPLPLYSWTADTAPGINGLPAGAATPSVANKNIIVNPTSTTIYTVTVADPVTSCGISTTTSTVTVNQNSTIALSSAIGTDAQTVCIPNALIDITYTIAGGGTGASITAGSLPAGLTASYNAGTFTISGSPTEFGNFSYTITTAGPCVNVSVSGTLTVNTAPVLTCPANEVINTDAGVCHATRTYSAGVTGFPEPTVSYLVDGNFISFPYDFPAGITTVQVLAEGGCAPDAVCSFTVTVQDLEAPTADLASLPVATGECSVTVTDVPTATDPCDGPIAGTTTDPLTYNAQGTYTITWTYTDTKNNASTQTQTVIVNDVTAPVITCTADQAYCFVPTNTYTVPVLIAADNCTITAITYAITGATTRSGTGNDASGIFNIGVSSITWTVTDGNNNMSVCSTNVTISIPPVAPTVTGITNVCPYLGTNEQITYTASAVDATSYNWSVPPNVVIVSGQGTANLTVTFNTGFSAQANKQIKVSAASFCGTSTQTIYYLLTQYPNTPPVISGPTNVCALIGTGNIATYSITAALSAVSYVWSGPTGTTITHPNGPGVNDITIDVTFDNTFNGGSISVTALNGCGTSGTRSLNIPKIPSSKPGLISGPTNICPYVLPNGTAATYSIAPVENATSYTWNVPAGSTLTHPNGPGANDVVITVQFPVGFSSGTVSVSSSNGCGTSGLRSLGLNKLSPATPSVIDVIQLQPCPNRVYSYTLSAAPANSTSLVWTVPTAQGAVIINQTATSITVSYPSTSVEGVISVQSFNNCGSSAIRSTGVKLPACPPEAFTKQGNSSDAKGQSVKPENSVDQLQLVVYANPSTTDFKVEVVTAGKEKINLRILDMQGRSFKQITVSAFQIITIGADLKPGAYILECMQGNKKITQKLIKF